MKITTKISSVILVVVGLFFFASCGGPDVSELNDALDELEESLEDIDVEEALDEAVENVSTEAFVDEDGFFSIKFPGEPTVESQNVPTEVGDIEMVTFMYEKSATEVYMVAYSDYPSALIEMSDPAELLQGAKDGALGTYGATISEESEVEMDGNPGMMFKANSDSYYVTYEIYLVDNRLYQIVILKDGSYPSEDDYNTFIKSFTLL
jgi:hypothetical protein